MAEVLVVDAAVDEVQAFEVHSLQFSKHGTDAGLIVGGLADGKGGLPYLLPTAVEVRVGDNMGKAGF